DLGHGCQALGEGVQRPPASQNVQRVRQHRDREAAVDAARTPARLAVGSGGCSGEGGGLEPRHQGAQARRAGVILASAAPSRAARLLVRHRRVLAATTRVEIEKRYSGSFLGLVWVVLYPVLFLCIYLFLYL